MINKNVYAILLFLVAQNPFQIKCDQITMQHSEGKLNADLKQRRAKIDRLRTKYQVNAMIGGAAFVVGGTAFHTCTGSLTAIIFTEALGRQFEARGIIVPLTIVSALSLVVGSYGFVELACNLLDLYQLSDIEKKLMLEELACIETNI